MENKKQDILIGIMGGILAGTAVLAILVAQIPGKVRVERIEVPITSEVKLAGVPNYLDTSSSDITHATTSLTVGSTSQIFASITKMGQIILGSASSSVELTCVMDATNTTSTVTLGNGLLLRAAHDVYSSSTASIMFGECYQGSTNCYPHKGAVSCRASATTTVTYWSK